MKIAHAHSGGAARCRARAGRPAQEADVR
ncbi:RNA polymerase subunit sigma-54 [Burkholderia pseudomallei]|nr:RNA polymerase subunit sigma-54 [Burkholderia pseudomallei]EQA85818.1 RNA polymerase subunit sigma-54 [Burkholderia pseudomallei MSHR338]ALB10597.1 RNA polymerase subunit sigma-54 [Burkholderia pseudomallei]ALB97830.1 RNA polymerase subunit sigma-54 [Burkholderia pseudomallei]ALC03869.1 RNA polymerase subunit sigma-54 [Burkholderia pseudomallei]